MTKKGVEMTKIENTDVNKIFNLYKLMESKYEKELWWKAFIGAIGLFFNPEEKLKNMEPENATELITQIRKIVKK
jgi:hypothetical protein